jgi:hypothetical protein
MLAGKMWSKHPSGCSLPAATTMPEGTSLAAVAADEHTIMLLRAAPPVYDAANNRQQEPDRVDLLDLRMWRWRERAALQRDCLHGVGLVEYDGGGLVEYDGKVLGHTSSGVLLDSPVLQPGCTSSREEAQNGCRPGTCMGEAKS